MMNNKCTCLLPAAAIALWLLALGALFAISREAMVVDRGDMLIRGTARISLSFWAIAIVLLLRRDPNSRLTWTLAWLAFLIHIATAFEYAHGWSHVNAVHHVDEVSGFGPGIFVSYFFAVVWTADTVWRWLNPINHQRRPRWIDVALHVFMIFVIVNSTIVFESGAIRWVSAATFALLMVMLINKRAGWGRS